MALEISGISCWVCDVRSVERAFRLLSDLGALVGMAERGADLEAEARQSWEEGRLSFNPGQGRKVAYAVWRNPVDVGGPRCLHPVRAALVGMGPLARGTPAIRNGHRRGCDHGVEEVLLPSEPFPFKEDHKAECQGLDARLVDGEAFSWYGSRMLRCRPTWRP